MLGQTLPIQIESVVKNGLEKVLCLALGFVLLRTQPVMPGHNRRKLLLERKRRNRYPDFPQIL